MYEECHLKGSFAMNQRILNSYVEQQRAFEAADHLNMLAMNASETNSTTSASDTSTGSQMTEADMITINTYIDFLHAYQSS